MLSSSNCFRSTSPGAFVIKSVAFCVFGNAMQSRMLSSTSEQHHDAVDSKRDASMWRSAELQRIQQESKAFLGGLWVDAKQVKNLLLNF